MENLMWHNEELWDDTVYLFPLKNNGFVVVFDGHFSMASTKQDAIEMAKNLIGTTHACDALILHDDGKIGPAYDFDEDFVPELDNVHSTYQANS